MTGWALARCRLGVGVTLALLLTACAPPTNDGVETVTINGETFELELSADDASRAQGLMGRDHIPADGGMLFVFPDAQVRSFWMANCITDIDLMFLDPRGRVTAVHRMKTLPPRRADETVAAYEARCSAAGSGSVYPAQFAIELAPGSLDRLGIGVEDRIELDLDRLKALAR
ncbi:MAG: DUF192 domain-containing protein [Phycisphaerales bacterium]|nr:DUF192 domain-containing protein [Phycisphaerae bacterium]NNF44433.1 DUF192 domain-containing protein [Phycisphaerales bacterium]NNM26208.1 DUF192 domain-containing protein [Phycisphaerales bacterium]